jgi:pimeloyl-ACP methyl ester carboxylesterase
MSAPYRARPVASNVVRRARLKPTRRRAWAVIAAAGVALAGCGSARGSTPAAPPAAAAHPSVDWTSCPAGDDLPGLQCATVRVPLDYADPARGTIGIFLDRHRATGRAIGSLLENPGGPGVSGADFLPGLLGELAPSITSRFDVVGFDPRGVGRSDPVTCGTGPQLDEELAADPSPTTAAGFAALVRADRRFDAGCEARSGRILPYVSTADAARDMDRIRAALGDARLTYLGFSYGTFLGAAYARLFPTHIRAMVLDGAIDPALGLVAIAQPQSAALDRELDAFFASCSAGSCGWRPAGNLHDAFAALVRQVRAHPVAVAGADQTVGPAAVLYGAADALYSPTTWNQLGQALTALEGGDGGPMLSLFDSYIGRNANGTYTNVVEAESAVNCMDYPAPTLTQLRSDAAATVRLAPVFGLLDLYSEITCSVWPLPATGRPAPVAAAGSPPIVVVGSTGDPVTPYAWAVALAHELDHGVLLTRTGYGHTGYGFSSCVRTDVDSYLLTTKPPVAGTTCPSN